MQDAWHPVGLATLLIFCFLSVKYTRTFWEYGLAGLVFFYALWYFRTLVILGNLDFLLSVQTTRIISRFFYAVLAVFFLYYGFLLWLRWWRIRIKKEEFPQPAAGLPTGSRVKHVIRILRSMLLAYLLAFFLVMVSSIATRDYDIFIMILNAYSKKVNRPELVLTGRYYLGSVCLLLGAWLVFGMRFVPAVARWSDRKSATLNILFSAVFMATSVGLFMVLLK